MGGVAWPYKFVGDGGSVALFNLENDPDETVNLALAETEFIADLRRAMWATVAGIRSEAATGIAPALSEEDRVALRALGYIQ